MSALEQDLRATFSALAEEAPGNDYLLTRVTARARRRTRARRVGMLAGAATAAAAVVLVATVHQDRPSSLRYSHDPGDFFQDGSHLHLSVPLTLRPPADFGGPRLEGTPYGSTLSWNNRDHSAALTMSLSSETTDEQDVDPDLGPVTTATTQVRGHAARLRCNPSSCAVVWRESPSLVVSILFQTSVHADRTKVVDIAGTLRRAHLVVKQQLVLSLVPEDCRLAEATVEATVLTGPRDCEHVYASVLTGRRFTITGQHRLVDGRDAVIGSYGVDGDPLAPLAFRMQLRLSDGRILEVMAPQHSHWDEDLLVDFARGVRA